MKRTATGQRINRNGKPYKSVEIAKESYEGASIKVNGEYYFYTANRQGKSIYELI